MGNKLDAARTGPAVSAPGRRSGPAPLPSAMIGLQRLAGNRAVRQMAQPKPPAKPAVPKPAEKLHLAGDTLDFTTKSAKLGDVEVHFTGRLTVAGSATFDGETIPE